MKLYYFGVRRKGEPGHYLWEPDERYSDGLKSGETYENKDLPFHFTKLDGGFLTEGIMTPQLTHFKGWTIWSMWDYTGDSRGGSNSSFVAEGTFTEEEMRKIASEKFPNQYKRVFGIS